MLIYNTSSVRSTKRQNARVAQRWSTSLPRRGSRVRSPSRALLDKKDFPDWEVLFCYLRSAMHFLNSYCWSSMGSISQSAKALFGRANTEVHRTSWLLNALKRLSVVPMQRSTGPLGTRLAYSNISIIFSLAEYPFLSSTCLLWWNNRWFN